MLYVQLFGCLFVVSIIIYGFKMFQIKCQAISDADEILAERYIT